LGKYKPYARETNGFFSFTFDNREDRDLMFQLMHQVDPLTITREIAGRLCTKEANNGEFPAADVGSLNPLIANKSSALEMCVQNRRQAMMIASQPARLDLFRVENGYSGNGMAFMPPFKKSHVEFGLTSDGSQILSSTVEENFAPLSQY
jgi:hypothetical protein